MFNMVRPTAKNNNILETQNFLPKHNIQSSSPRPFITVVLFYCTVYQLPLSQAGDIGKVYTYLF